jgi:hypothetical protein
LKTKGLSNLKKVSMQLAKCNDPEKSANYIYTIIPKGLIKLKFS